MARRAIIVASLYGAGEMDGSSGPRAGVTADWLQVMADRCGDLDADRLRERFGGSLLYSLAPGNAGTARARGRTSRPGRLRSAARAFDLVELEALRDLTPEILDHVPPEKRLVTWRGRADDVDTLARAFDRMTTVQARFYRIVTLARRPADALVPLAFLVSIGRDDTLAYAAGACGFWSRLIAPHLGCPMVFARLDEAPEPADSPSVRQLVHDYGLPRLVRPRELFGIVGSPVLRSGSPRLHNAGYRALGRQALYLPFQVDSFADFWRDVVVSPLFARLGMSFEGFTVVSPNKQAASAVATSSAPLVRLSASCNVLRRSNQGWTSNTTDPQGVLDCLGAIGLSVRGKRSAVVGCGGAGRTIAAALAAAGSEVTLVNRSAERGRFAARALGLPVVALDDFRAGDMAIIVHATPLGRCETDPLPFEPAALSVDAVVVDLVYGPRPTRLASRARERGCLVLDGHDVLRAQARQQFELMTGRELPPALTGAEPRPDTPSVAGEACAFPGRG